ncbi:MAG: T9SS type A sorting domain-containing protein [Phaeodactylibacter sp.]|nr:T9SS type A sorting domain-containing protein [Phaeodactylibacter sp.]MCB9276441.1 T9SS type A sorting domain-containing protein [Lewinellaceae bacterium]
MQQNYSTLFLLLALLGFGQLQGQDCPAPQGRTYLHANDVRALITQGGSLFFDGSDAAFQVPYGSTATNTIFAQGLWLGAFDPGGNLKLSAQTYGLNNGYSDYAPGPLDEMGNALAENCQDWDRVWAVSRFQIEAHIADFADNGVIDSPQPEIMSWPGRGNPQFFDYNGFMLPDINQGLAPYFDYDSDGQYDPLDGDYPMIHQSAIIPEQITWHVYNDPDSPHTETQGLPLGVEIQLTSWAFNCADSPLLNNTIFTSYKLINRAAEQLDSLYFALWTDFDLGCYTDDFVGSVPQYNSYFVYNRDNIDGEEDGACPSGINSYGENPPVQSATVLNRPLSYFMYYDNNVDGPPAMSDPNLVIDHYYLMTGRWRDGIPLTFGDSGYDPSLSNPVTSFAFPDDPNDPNGWSAYTASPAFADRRTIASVNLGSLPPGAIEVVDVAYAFFREENANFLENVSAMYDGLGQLQGWYDSQFETGCSQPATCQEDCVWAGDLNADGIANHCDLLSLGLGLTRTGPTRPSPYNWSPHNGEDWSGAQHSGVNDKHLDADGNGLVETEDFGLTIQHYNLTRPGYTATDEYPVGPELYLTANTNLDNLQAGQSFFLRVYVQNVPDLHGLAFSVEYSPDYFQELLPIGSSYDPNAIDFLTDIPERGQLDFAYIHAEPDGQIEGSNLFTILAKTRASFPEPLPSNTSPIRFKNIKAIRADGSEIEIGGTLALATFPDIMTGTVSPAFDARITLFPNPTTGRLYLNTQGQAVSRAELFSPTGQRLWQKTGGIRDGEALQLGHLPDGLYYLRLQVGRKMVVQKVMVRA